MLDAAYASISAVRQFNGASQVTAVLTPQEVAAIGAELGLRASDLVQSNAVVWVEGPSDRVYMKAWLAEIAPELIEGVHFSLLFYGGALLRHLSPDDPAVADFISLPRVNRNFWVVMDSDRTSEDQALGETKVRVRDALASYPDSAEAGSPPATRSRTTCRRACSAQPSRRSTREAIRVGPGSNTSTRWLPSGWAIGMLLPTRRRWRRR